MTTAPVVADEAPPIAPLVKNPPGRWRSVQCALNDHDGCTDKHCGCNHHFDA